VSDADKPVAPDAPSVPDASAAPDPPRTSKRLATLEKLAASERADAFTKYGLAMEYIALERVGDAEKAFVALRAFDPTYVPMYYQAGVLLKTAGRAEGARTWLTQGVAQAEAKGDTHALGEIEGVLAGL